MSHCMSHCTCSTVSPPPKKKLNVVRSFGQLLDHGSLSKKKLSLVKDGGLMAVKRVRIRLGLPRSRVMPLRLMLNRIGSDGR